MTKSSVIGELKSSEQATVLTALIGYLTSPSLTSLDRLFPNKKQQSIVQAIYFLLDNQSPNNIYQFVSDPLPRIIEQLHHTTTRINVEYQGRVRGRVVWSATYKARCSQDYNPNLYSCRQVQLDFDTPENQLLKHLIERIHYLLQSVPKVIRSGFLSDAEKSAMLPIVTRLQVLESRIQETLRNIYLRQITSIMQVTPIHLHRAENSRLEEYAAIVNLYHRLSQIGKRADWHPFQTDGQRFLLLPHQANPSTEVWIQAAAALVRTYHLHQGVADG
jgi:hypothetical protein